MRSEARRSRANSEHCEILRIRTRLFFFQAEDGIRDHCVTWSSDVCSSDLLRDKLSQRAMGNRGSTVNQGTGLEQRPPSKPVTRATTNPKLRRIPVRLLFNDPALNLREIGRASCRERV